jgi:hypothetical protein
LIGEIWPSDECLRRGLWRPSDEVEHGHPGLGLRPEPPLVEELALKRGECASTQPTIRRLQASSTTAFGLPSSTLAVIEDWLEATGVTSD